MSWSELTLAYQVSTSVMLLICFLAYRLDRSAFALFVAAGVVFVFTVTSYVITRNSDPPWSSAHMPIQDVICTALAMVTWRRTGQRWARWLAIPFMVQCAIHAAYWGAIALVTIFAPDTSITPLTRLYPWLINPLFIIELAILTTAGGGYVLGYVRSRLPVLRSLSSHMGAHTRSRR